jgi:hypothetical protein
MTPGLLLPALFILISSSSTTITTTISTLLVSSSMPSLGWIRWVEGSSACLLVDEEPAAVAAIPFYDLGWIDFGWWTGGSSSAPAAPAFGLVREAADYFIEEAHLCRWLFASVGVREGWGEVGGVVDPKLVLEEELDVVPLFGKAGVWVCCAEEM